MKLTEIQKKQLEKLRISEAKLQNYLDKFRNGFPQIQLLKPATIGDGIFAFDSHSIESYLERFEREMASKKMVKFVPASGAASRMFKYLYEALAQNDFQDEKVQEFLVNLSKFPFYNDLKEVLAIESLSLENLLEKKDYQVILTYFLTEKGLAYGNLPKALLKFHNNNNAATTALEEQLFEAANYCTSDEGIAHLHFTVSPEFIDDFTKVLHEKGKVYEERFQVNYEVAITCQLESTNTIAVDFENNPIVLENGEFLFRPGGHGALIENLNQETADLIFIKNIDNVSPEFISEKNSLFKKVLAAVAMEVLECRNRLLKRLESADWNENLKEEIESFAKNYLFMERNFSNANHAKHFLNRPIRVCGMVRNQGEPGGGPFWVTKGNHVSLQIVEASQVDKSNSEQVETLKKSTHFNPVDIVCCTKDYRGNKFDLLDFVDEETGFISEKYHEGKALKSLEIPGLWNGAMANWLTVFIEVPLQTFSPVKTVNDLLKKEHQGIKGN